MRHWPHWLRRWAIPAHEAAALRRENFTLRDALRNANDELARHRRLLVAIQTGEREALAALGRIFASPR